MADGSPADGSPGVPILLVAATNLGVDTAGSGRHSTETTPTPSGISMRELERDLPTDAEPSVSARGALPALAIVGAGRMGGALAKAAGEEGLEVSLAGRESALQACREAEAALICVPDDAIRDVAASIGEAIPPLRLVGHTSGATTLHALAPAAGRGAATFSLHPLQTVPGPDAELVGAACAVTGSEPEAERFAARLGERLGMRPFEVPDSQRAAYHAAASIASNFLVALEESAAELFERVGIEDARELLAPLVRTTAANWADHGAEALTGPIARGDEATVERHLAALRETAPELVSMYEQLAARTRDLAEARRAQR
jgi:predicted short-subunit dehydrogenase-like oxidoreductase (DUF2520 family)